MPTNIHDGIYFDDTIVVGKLNPLYLAGIERNPSLIYSLKNCGLFNDCEGYGTGCALCLKEKEVAATASKNRTKFLYIVTDI